MTDQLEHLPTPEFRDDLEWEVRRAVRRDVRLVRSRPLARAPWMRAAALVAISVAIGTTAGFASAQVRDGARRDSLLQSARADADLTALRLKIAREQLADAMRQVNAGAATSSSASAAMADVRTLEAEAMRAKYNIEEIIATAQQPRDDFNAPVVGKRDFVRERLNLDAYAAQEILNTAESAQADAERRVRAGAASDLTRLDAETSTAAARAALAVVAKRLELRREFLEKGTPVEQLFHRLTDFRVRMDASVAQQALVASRARLALVEKQRATGAVGEVELLKAQLDVKERENVLQSLMARLKETGRAVRDSLR